VARWDDVRKIALALPGVTERQDGFGFSVGKKQFCWAWNERVHPKKPRVPRPDVLAVRVAGADEKAALLAGDPDTFFTEPHYDGFPAVLVRLPAIKLRELRKLVGDAHRIQSQR